MCSGGTSAAGRRRRCTSRSLQARSRSRSCAAARASSRSGATSPRGLRRRYTASSTRARRPVITSSSASRSRRSTCTSRASATASRSSSEARSRGGSPPTRTRSATGSEREARTRSRPARRAGDRRAAGDHDLAGGGDLRGAARGRLACARAAPAAVPGRDADDGAPVRRPDAARRGARHARALDRPDDPCPRHARRDDGGASKRPLPGSPPRRRGTRLRRLRALARPRPAARLRRLDPALDGRRGPRDAARPAPRARRARPSGRAARQECGARAGAPAVAVARRVARTRPQPRRGDGGARPRARGAHARAARPVGPARRDRDRRRGRDRDRGGTVALARVDSLTFSYTGGARVLDDVSLEIEPGEHLALFGPSGSGKSTLLRALAALVPHFHGGTFAGSVVVGGIDTRTARPSELAGTVASVFQDPEDQVVMSKVANEVAFGLENTGADPSRIWPRVEEALAMVAAEHLADRATGELSGGELQRVSLASALALEPKLLLLDEPTSQLDPDAAEAFFGLVERLPCAVLVSEQRPARPLAHVGRVLFMDGGRIVLDAPRDEALAWLGAHRPLYLPHAADVVCRVRGVRFAYGERAVLEHASLEVRRGEVVALTGPNGVGKTTLAQIAAGLLEPAAGEGWHARAGYLAQDPGRHLVTERVLDEVALGADVARARARLGQLGLAQDEQRHPRDLSAGERERLALAAVLSTDPELLVLDEPTRGVDPERKQELARLLRAQAPRRGTVVVTHDLVWAAEVADRIVQLDVREGVRA